MTDIEKIRAEIERLQEIHERNLKKPMERGRIGYAHGVIDCCDKILSFIDSLSEEHDKDLSEKIAAAYQLGLANKEEQMMKEWLQDRDGCFWDGVEEGKRATREQMLKEIEDAKDFEKVLADVFQSATTLVSSPSELVDAFKGKLLRSAFKCFAEKKALRQSLFAKQFSELPDEIKAVIERIAHDSCYTFCESFASLVAADKSYRKGKHDMKEQMMKDAVEGEVYQYHSYNRDATAILVDIPKENLGEKVRVIIVKEDKE